MEKPKPSAELEYHASLMIDMVPHLSTLIQRASEAKSILELGVRSGVSTWALLDGLPADGIMVSVDINPNCFDERGYFEFQRHDPVEREAPKRISEDKRWTFIAGNDRSPEVQAQIKACLPEQVDLVFIDTSHEYEHTLEELFYSRTLGAKAIVLHDWMLEDVERAVREFCDGTEYDIADVEPSQWGLVTLTRRDT